MCIIPEMQLQRKRRSVCIRKSWMGTHVVHYKENSPIPANGVCSLLSARGAGVV